MKAWKSTSLGDACEILDSQRKPITKRDRDPGPYPYYGATGILDYVKGYIFSERLLLVGEDGAKWGAGDSTAFIIDGPAWVNNHAHVLRPRSSIVLDKWLLYYLNGSDLTPFVSGLTVPKLNQGRLREILVPTPAVAEQRRIVGILDEAFAGLEAMRVNAERNLANVGELFEAELESVLSNESQGWRQTRIGDIADTQYGLSLPMNTEGTGFKIFRMGEVQNGRLIDAGRMKHVDISQSEFSVYKLNPGDVLFNRTNSYELVGKTGIFDLEGDYCFASYLIRLIVRNQRIDTRLLNYIMNTSRFQEQVKRKAAKSVNQANINATILSNEIISFPIDRSEQISIVERFDAFKETTENLATSYRSKLRTLDELRKSLLHQAFSGNL